MLRATRTNLFVALTALAAAACSRTQELPPKPPPLEYLGRWGSKGDGPAELKAPVSLAADAFANVYIADARSGATLVHKFDRQGHPLLAFFVEGARQPEGITVDQGGAIYLVERRPGGIHIFLPDGSPLRTIRRSSGRPLDTPEGIAVDAEGNLYVVESAPGRILELDVTGRRLRAWGRKGSGAGEFDFPSKVALGPDGLLYVADAGNHRIEKFSAQGEFVAAWDCAFTARTSLSQGLAGYGLAVSRKYVVASDAAERLIEIWTPDGQFKLKEAALEREGFPEPPVPVDVALSPDGELLVLDAAGPRVLRFRIHF